MRSYQYDYQRAWLMEVLADAQDRGDYHLEMDVKEKLEELDQTTEGESE